MAPYSISYASISDNSLVSPAPQRRSWGMCPRCSKIEFYSEVERYNGGKSS